MDNTLKRNASSMEMAIQRLLSSTSGSRNHSKIDAEKIFPSKRVMNRMSSIIAKTDKNTVIDIFRRGPTYDTIEELTTNPIKSGFLLAFCESEFSAENMRYIVEIHKFHDFFITTDPESWNKFLNWRAIDEFTLPPPSDNNHDDNQTHTSSQSYCLSPIKRESSSLSLEDSLAEVGNEDLWPSTKISFSNTYDHVQKIWSTFLSPKSPHEICVSHVVLANTKIRLRNIHLYGGCVFEETLIEPIATLKTDTLPRFLKSKHYKKLLKRIDTLYPLPEAEELVVPAPSNSHVALWPRERITSLIIKQMTLTEVINDRIVYLAFLEYCSDAIVEENLLCARAIAVFKESFVKGSNQSDDYAWDIFKFFIAPKSAYEIGLSDHRRKKVMISLGNPSIDMFARVEKSAFIALEGHWQSFTKSETFNSLPEHILEEKYNVVVGKSKPFSAMFKWFENIKFTRTY